MASPITLKMLRMEYSMSKFVFNNQIEAIRDKLFMMSVDGDRKKSKKNFRLRTLSPQQVKYIRNFLGNPDEYKTK